MTQDGFALGDNVRMAIINGDVELRWRHFGDYHYKTDTVILTPRAVAELVGWLRTLPQFRELFEHDQV